VRSADGQEFEADLALGNQPPLAYDALVLPDGDQAVHALGNHEDALSLIKNQYWHGNAIFVLGASSQLIEKAGLPLLARHLDADDQIFMCGSTCSMREVSQFVAAITES
jgi:catalase